jgi:RNA:NAD 2'-phosphotransferase (TPT1/KptA family)
MESTARTQTVGHVFWQADIFLQADNGIWLTAAVPAEFLEREAG